MSHVIDVVNKVNESLSIYRAVFICKDEENVIDVMKMLYDNDYACATDLDEPEHCRILVQTFETFIKDDDVDLTDITVIYTNDMENLTAITYVAKLNNVGTLVIV